MGDIDGSIAAWSEARAGASSDIEACEIELGLAQSLRVKDAHREADAALARAEEIALRQGLDLALSRINFVRGNLRFPQGRLDECLAAHEAALHYGRRAHSIEAELRALGGIGDAQYAIGRMLSAHKAFSECVGLAHEHGFGRIEVANLPMLSFTTLAAGDMTGALQVEDRALGLARRVEALRAEMIAIQTACFRLLETEETNRAREYLMRSREIATRLGTTRFQAENFALLARLDFLEGERGSAIRLAREAWGMIDDTGKRFLGPMLLGVLRVTSDDEVERQWAVDEARLLLRESTLAHNHLLFNRLVLQDALDHEAWQEAYRCCDDLDRFVAPEPFPWATFLIRWGRALADLGSGEAGANLQAELDWVLAEANRFGFTRCARSICQSLTAGAQSR
jgi:tetratricopeptide (TPR) repeat protein